MEDTILIKVTVDDSAMFEAAEQRSGDIKFATAMFNVLCSDTETEKQVLTDIINEMEPSKRKEFINSLK